jgi:hypothetical protein
MSMHPINHRIRGSLLTMLLLLIASTPHADAQSGWTHSTGTLEIENQRCADYASGAVRDYQTMRKFQKCLVPDSPRWQNVVDNHYRWCLTTRPESLAAENRARTDHLKRCGASHNF